MRATRTTIKRAAFLESLAKGVSVSAAFKLATLSRSAAYAWRDKDPEFSARWKEAIASGTDMLIDEMRRRAVEGVRKPIMHQGRICYRLRDSGDVEELWVCEYSDTLAMFLAKSRDPERYDDGARRARLERQWAKEDGKTGQQPCPAPCRCRASGEARGGKGSESRYLLTCSGSVQANTRSGSQRDGRVYTKRRRPGTSRVAPRGLHQGDGV
jgi:hypothetical protein